SALHLGAGRSEPGHDPAAQLLVIDADQEPVAAQDRVFVAQRCEPLDKVDLRCIFFLQIPIDPADLVVLAMGVVVAVLCTGELVAGEQHRGALRQHQGAEEVAHLAGPQCIHFLVIGRAFDATIPGAVVRMAVLVFFAVRLVVLVVVGNEVIEREPVMDGDEIDRRPRFAAAMIEYVTRAAKAGSKRASRRSTAPEIADYITELVVPFGPAGREGPDLVAAEATIPRLRD